jgi:hypothetical protein
MCFVNSYIFHKCVCLSSGKEIATQKSGKSEAHKCRNTNSNHRNNFKRKVEVIQGRGLLFDIMPFFIFNNKESLAIGENIVYEKQL